MNITELARRLRTNPDELREKLPQLGFDVGSKAIKVDDRLVGKIMRTWSEYKRKERLKAKYVKEERIKEEARERVKRVELPKVLTIREFADKLGLPINIAMQEFMKNGILASVNERIDFDTASIVADDLGYQVGAEPESLDSDLTKGGMSAEDLKQMINQESEENLKTRPPVVVVMGHVDHGKTQLLDKIRETSVVAGEAGGITQHIGAYQAEKKGRHITFIDTPGHEAFTVMRSRGARVADIAILVVAADDGVQPQTIEVINIIKAAKLPFVVALNKIDKPDIDIQHVLTQLSEQKLIPEEWGGNTIISKVSAKTGEGLDSLLDTILLVADMEKDAIRSNPDQRAIGTVIESHVDRGEGVVATVLVQNGTLKRNDILAVGGTSFGRVRAMKDWNGGMVDEAPPGMPVKILGFKVAPQVGDLVEVPEDERKLKKARKQYASEQRVSSSSTGSGEDDGDEHKKRVLPVVLKADVLGSLEAIIGTLEKFKTPDVSVSIVSRGLGHVTESDVLQAEAVEGVVYGFNVSSTKDAEILAKDKAVDTKFYKIIYELFDDVKDRLQAMLPIEVIREDLGKLEVLAQFKGGKGAHVIGGRVTDGKVTKNVSAVIYRDGEPIDEGSVLQLQVGKGDVSAVHQGQECGIKLSTKKSPEIGDVIEFFTEERKERKLEFPQYEK